MSICLECNYYEIENFIRIDKNLEWKWLEKSKLNGRKYLKFPYEYFIRKVLWKCPVDCLIVSNNLPAAV